jgi:hypothetical protein
MLFSFLFRQCCLRPETLGLFTPTTMLSSILRCYPRNYPYLWDMADVLVQFAKVFAKLVFSIELPVNA